MVLEQNSVGHFRGGLNSSHAPDPLPRASGSARGVLNGFVSLPIFHCSGRGDGSWSSGKKGEEAKEMRMGRKEEEKKRKWVNGNIEGTPG